MQRGSSRTALGARRSVRVDDNLDRVRLFAEPLRSLALDDECAEHYAVVRTDLAARGTQIAPNEALISAIAVAHAVALVTRNQRDFERAANLKLEIW